MLSKILIAGTCVRAYLESALAARFEVQALDLFADWDAQASFRHFRAETGEIRQIKSFDKIQPWVDSKNAEFALISGGIETRNQLVRQIGTRAKLLGPNAEQLARICNSVKLYPAMRAKLSEFGGMIPKTRHQAIGLAPETQWLRKRIGSSGGVGMERLQSAHLLAAETDDQEFYVQEFVSGKNISVLFVSDDAAGTTAAMGATKQLVGTTATGSLPFQYSGSIGPFSIDQLGQETKRQICMIGQYLGSEYQLAGVWGVDFIVNEQGAWPVDVNPRLTASTELFESRIAQTGRFKSAVDLHVFACGVRGHLEQDLKSEELLRKPINWSLQASAEGKAILFNQSPSRIKIGSALAKELIRNHDPSFFASSDCPFSLADIPNTGVTIGPREPILTIRVRCKSHAEVERQLTNQTTRIYKLLSTMASTN
ncbi:MAG: ATP-grasp domain-containing protein [Mariniblastus sp.]|nr:ATP-grasp domain-containing protein [Mariniblastus sp.]